MLRNPVQKYCITLCILLAPALAVAVTEAELEALEKQIQEQEIQKQAAEKARAEAQRKAAEDARKKAAREQQKAAANKTRRNRKQAFSWETYRQLQGKWGVPIKDSETSQLIFYNTDITLENEKLVFTGVNGNVTHTFNITPDGDPEVAYRKPCEYDSAAVGNYQKICTDTVIIPRDCEVSAEISANSETITVYIRTPELSSDPCSQEEWITFISIYERVPR
ncbi:MAG: hypothetical protein MI673_07295 [Thiotrichales bacterium]|nr:hypothetical protein [Thiotrichales bacterium]